MSFAQLLLKVSDGTPLTGQEREELKAYAENMERNSSVMSSWLQPGTTIPHLKNLQVDTIRIRAVEHPSSDSYLYWVDENGTRVAELASQYVSGDAVNMFLNSIRRNSGEDSYASLMTSGVGGAGAESPLTFLQLQSDGQMFVDLQNGTNNAVGAQSVDIKTKPNITNQVNSVLYLDTDIAGTPAAGLGTAIVFRAKNTAGVMKTMGYIYVSFTDPTSGTEDTKVVAGYLVNNVVTEKQLAP
jgi:hypothetical protein